MGKRYLAICNPAAGGGRCGQRAPEALNRLRESGIDIEVVETTAAGDGITLAREAYEKGQRHFIAIGGDGTSYEIVNGLFPLAIDAAEPPTLGFLPLGTGNSFLRDFTEDGETFAFEALKAGRTSPCDVIRLNCVEGDIYYINLASIGFVADVGLMTNRRFKWMGESGYGLATVLQVVGLKPRVYPMRVDGGQTQTEASTFISFNNSRFTGGKMMMAPHAEVADGKAAVVVAGKMGRISLLRTFPKIFKGEHLAHPSVDAFKASTVDFSLEEAVPIMVDGEIVVMTPKRLTVLPGALRVRV
jgi:diacylglycerol kinase (ATP)